MYFIYKELCRYNSVNNALVATYHPKSMVHSKWPRIFTDRWAPALAKYHATGKIILYSPSNRTSDTTSKPYCEQRQHLKSSMLFMT